MSIFASLRNLFGKSNGSEYIQDKNGHFLGRRPGESIIPSPSPFSSFDSKNNLGTPPASPSSVPSYWDVDVAPLVKGSVAERFTSALDEVINFDERQGYVKKSNARNVLKSRAIEYASSNLGQLEVLKKAKELVNSGEYEKASILIDGAEIARKDIDRKAGENEIWVAERILKNLSKTLFDNVDDAIADFRAAAGRKVTVPPAGYEAAKELPFDSLNGAKALQTIAGIVSAAGYAEDRGQAVPRSSVYNADLVKEANKFGGAFLSPDPRDNNYVSPEYNDFIRHVEEAHKSSRGLIRSRLDRAIMAAESVVNHTQN